MKLPRAPSYGEKLSYVKTGKELLYPFSITSVIILTIGSFIFALAHPPLLIFIPLFLLTASYLVLGYYIGLRSEDFDEVGHYEVQDLFLEDSKRFSVDVFLPTAGEPLEVLENAYRHVKELSWEHLKIYVLDDSKRDEVWELAKKYSFNYIRRDNAPQDKKAGNLRYAFKLTDSPFILILDADFCPRPDMLMEMMPWMLAGSHIGIVQSPQYFDLNDDNVIARASSFIQVLFYKMIQTNREHFNAAICVGSCGLYRRKALEPLGGTYLINYSEDVHTGVSLYPRYKVKYLPINLAMGLSPDTITAFFSQQQRWAAGSLALCTNKMFWDGRFNLNQILCYMTGFLYYITTALSIPMTGIPSLLMLMFYPDYLVWYAILFVIPGYFTTIYIWPKWTGMKFNWWVLRMRMVSYMSHLFALIDKLKGEMTPWVVTNSKTGHEKNQAKLTYGFLYVTFINLLVILLALKYFLTAGKVVVVLPVLIHALLSIHLSLPTLLAILKEKRS